MKKINWNKYHKWLGLFFGLFFMLFCVSGIILNHREWFWNCNISRAILPNKYKIHNWNNGFIKGDIRQNDTTLILYGSNGAWKLNNTQIEDYSMGLPKGVEQKGIVALVRQKDSSLIAATNYAIYKLKQNVWQKLDFKPKGRIADIILQEDTLLVLTRHSLYKVVNLDFNNSKTINFLPPQNYKSTISLSKLFVKIHRGEAFGKGGKYAVDALAIIFIIIFLSGLTIFIISKLIKYRSSHKGNIKPIINWFKYSFSLHEHLARFAFIFIFIIVLCGMFLRPPLNNIIKNKEVTLSKDNPLYSENPWYNKLRMIRYDNNKQDYLLYTTQGIYSLKTLNSIPIKIDNTPPINSKGINVWEPLRGKWLVASFSGAFVWNRDNGTYYNYQQGNNSNNAICGAIWHYNNKLYLIDNKAGTNFMPQPLFIANLPMPLRTFAMEVHTGRIFTFLGSSLFYPFCIGLGILCCIIVGLVISIKRKK